MTPVDNRSCYACVASLKSMRLALLIGEHNNMKSAAGDISSAHLEAKTKEKVCFIAGPEFGPLEGHTLVIYKAIYELRSSGARFRESLADNLKNEGFTPTLADADLWHRDAGECYECACLCV